MTGMEHYLEAEALLQSDGNPAHRAECVAMAQVHATLALAMFATGQEDSHE